jgi:DNA-binding beta-propeller fold protein YncE
VGRARGIRWIRDALHRGVLTPALLLASALVLAGVLAAPSFAARGHEFGGAFGWGVVSGAGVLQRCVGEPSPNCKPGLSGNGEGQFNDPVAVAVNEATGNVYVSDKANNRVEIFNAAGTKFEGEFNGSGLLPNEEGIAAGSGGLPEEVPTGQFDEPEEIAIDNSCALRHLAEPKCKEEDPSNGDVYVVDANGNAATKAAPAVIDKFSPTGQYIGQITRNPDGEELSEEPFRELFGVSVDPRGEVWVEEQNFGPIVDGAAHYTNAVANAWSAPFLSTESQGSELGTSAEAAAGFAVDSEDDLYVHNTFGPAGDRLAKFSSKEEEGSGHAKLITPQFDEEVPTGVAVELSSNDVYVAHATSVRRFDSSGVSLEVLGKVPGTPSLAGVAVDSKTLAVYAADPASNRIEVFSPEAPGRPTVQAESSAVSDVGTTRATFSAEVNPRSEANEAPTRYSFHYGPCESPGACPESPYPQSSPVGELAANYEPDALSVHVQDLSPHTVYHAHLVVENSHGETEGEEVIFTTQGAATAAPTDARQWQLVSPAQKHGAVMLPLSATGLIQASASGAAISYQANGPSEAEPAGFSQTTEILSRRGSSSWESQDIATPHEAPAGISLTGRSEYSFFSGDLASAIVAPVGPFSAAISAQGSEQTPYLRSNFAAGDPSDPCGASCYRPLVSGCPGEGQPCAKAVEEVADVPEGTKFGASEDNLAFLGASADASHVVLGERAALTEGAPEGESADQRSLYEWTGGKLALVSVLPNEQAAPTATKPRLGYANEEKGDNIQIARHAVSEDGSRVVFSAGELNVQKKLSGNVHLYLRDTLSAQTVQLDVPEAACTAKGKCKGAAQAVFQTASADDSRVFFSDSQPLTQSSGNSDLYECEIEEGEEGPECKLSDLTVPGSGEEGAGVLGLIAGASEDGETVYFAANGKLSGGQNARGEEAVAGDCMGDSVSTLRPESETAPERCNLYVRRAGQTHLVAVLSGADFPDFALREKFGLRGLTDRVSPDGRYLAFMSRRALSGYDNRDAQSGKPDQEVFLYDSDAGGGQGGLICASCEPSGGRPRGVQYKQINTEDGGLAGGFAIWPEGAWIAASVPSWAAISENHGFALYQSRYLSDAGRLFFNAADALVPEDSNGSEDVYEYEPPAGEGTPPSDSCTSASPTYSPASDGCIGLISSGEGKEESAFLDASESGDDVFFLTAQRLAPQDLDASLDVYDAHACSSASPCLPSTPAPPLACEASCQSPGAAPEDQTPGSLGFQGPGNPPAPAAPVARPKTSAQLKAEKLKQALKACHKQKKKHKRVTCEAKARKLYGAHKAATPKKASKKSKKASRGKRR